MQRFPIHPRKRKKVYKDYTPASAGYVKKLPACTYVWMNWAAFLLKTALAQHLWYGLARWCIGLVYSLYPHSRVQLFKKTGAPGKAGKGLKNSHGKGL